MTTDLGENITAAAPPPPAPPPPPQAQPEPAKYVMAQGEPFTREEYHAASWSDAQLLAVGKMIPAEFTMPAGEAPVGMPDRKWIVLDDNDEIPPTGLFVGHNGIGYLITPGIPVPVPTVVLGVINDAIMLAPVLDPTTKQVKGYRPRPRYTFREVPAPEVV